MSFVPVWYHTHIQERPDRWAPLFLFYIQASRHPNTQSPSCPVPQSPRQVGQPHIHTQEKWIPMLAPIRIVLWTESSADTISIGFPTSKVGNIYFRVSSATFLISMLYSSATFLVHILGSSATFFRIPLLPFGVRMAVWGWLPSNLFRQRCRKVWEANFCRHKTRRYPRVEGQLWGRYTQHPLTNRTTRTLRPITTSCEYCPLLPVLSSATRLLIHHGVTSMKTFSGIECLRF